jgi:hypothetical protein
VNIGHQAAILMLAINKKIDADQNRQSHHAGGRQVNIGKSGRNNLVKKNGEPSVRCKQPASIDTLKKGPS